MAPKDKPEAAAALPGFPSIEQAIRDLLAAGNTRISEIQSRLPEGMQVSADQIRGVMDEILNVTNLTAIRDAVTVDIFNLLVTGKSSVKHDPVNLA